MKKLASVVLYGIACLSLSGCQSNLQKEHIKYKHLINESEENIQKKTTVSKQPWERYIKIQQDHVYRNGFNRELNSKQNSVGITTDTFLTARIDKKTGNIDYYILIDMHTSDNVFQRMEYTDNGEKKSINATDLDRETRCVGVGIYTSNLIQDRAPSCDYEAKSLVKISRELVENISRSSAPFGFLLVSDSPEILPFHDIITAPEAHALLARVQQEKASAATSTDAELDAQP